VDGRLRGVMLRRDQVETMREHAAAAYPHECCGFLVGERSDGHAIVTDLVRASNAREDSPRNRYLIPPEEFARVLRDADRQGLDVLGFYHSHPDAPARPSEYDREHAWPAYAYLVLAVAGGVAGEIGAFELSEDGGAFAPLPWSEEGKPR
jgi:proteasome lid subunit RPN8/RPN11